MRCVANWTRQMQPAHCVVAAVFLLVMAGCGGGDGNSALTNGANVNQAGGGGSSSWTPNVFLPSSTFAAQCAAPRAGTSDTQGSATTENNWLRSWTNELYFWFDEVTDRDPASYATPAYFDLMKTTGTTASGADKDRFHFVYSTDEWNKLSQSGVSVGYGFEFAALKTSPPRQYLVAYVDPGYTVNVARGALVLSIDGVDLANDNTTAGIAVLNAGLFPATAGESHTFVVQDAGSSTPRSLTVTAANITSTPVQNVQTIATPSGTVGYMLFNDHVATAEDQLIAAIDTLHDANVADLVLDIRYNGGGFLYIASELAYMIAGPAATGGRTFERTQFNSKHPSTDPVTGQPLTPMPFFSTSSNNQGLPTLNLPRVFVLTGPSTCSASESIINSLRGVNVEVIQVGSTTCGKPYGFYPQDNCGTTYFSIEFKGLNDQNLGGYTDGFSPNNTVGSAGERIPGCSVADDFNHALGDPAEGRLAAALTYRTAPVGTCGTATGMAKHQMLADPSITDGRVHKAPWLQNRILSPRR